MCRFSVFMGCQPLSIGGISLSFDLVRLPAVTLKQLSQMTAKRSVANSSTVGENIIPKLGRTQLASMRHMKLSRMLACKTS